MKIIIAGGGLVGAICGVVLGKRGHQVHIYEYRDSPNSEIGKNSRGRSINLALSTRGRTTLREAGLEDLILSEGIPMRGRMLHSLDGSTREALYDPLGSQCIYSVSRQRLNDILLENAEKLENVKVHYRHKIIYGDPVKGEVLIRIRNENGKDSEIKEVADLIIGADGAHSAMRQSLLKRPMTNFSQTYIEHGYMELCIPSKNNGEHAMKKNYLHIWPRNRFMLIGLPNLDGSFTATLFMPFEIFGELNSQNKVIEFFNKQFPDAVNLIGADELAKDFLSSKPSNLISIKCSPLHAGKMVLMGDAAHAMVPFYGQGMNAGFEDVLILDRILNNCKKRESEIEMCLETFSMERRKDAEAICELAMYNYLEMRHLVNQKSYLWRRNLDLFLFKLLGNKWLPLYNSVTFSTIPYSMCISRREAQDRILNKSAKFGAATFIFATISIIIAYLLK